LTGTAPIGGAAPNAKTRQTPSQAGDFPSEGPDANTLDTQLAPCDLPERTRAVGQYVVKRKEL